MKTNFLLGALLLCATVCAAAAQPAGPVMDSRNLAGDSARQTRSEIGAAAGPNSLTAQQHAEIKDAVMSAREQAHATGVTREEVQAIRAALKARLAVLHH